MMQLFIRRNSRICKCVILNVGACASVPWYLNSERHCMVSGRIDFVYKQTIRQANTHASKHQGNICALRLVCICALQVKLSPWFLSNAYEIFKQHLKHCCNNETIVLNNWRAPWHLSDFYMVLVRVELFVYAIYSSTGLYCKRKARLSQE